MFPTIPTEFQMLSFFLYFPKMSTLNSNTDWDMASFPIESKTIKFFL